MSKPKNSKAALAGAAKQADTAEQLQTDSNASDCFMCEVARMNAKRGRIHAQH